MTLFDAASAYRALMKYRYRFLLGHKGKAETLVLSFPAEAFHHLAGLHKKEIERTKNKKHILEAILAKPEDFNACFSEEILDRWECMIHLREMIESNSLVFRLRNGALAGSRIMADYVLSDDIHLFFVRSGHPVSVFTASENKLKNVSRCLRLTTLKIDREDTETGITETVYVSKSYHP